MAKGDELIIRLDSDRNRNYAARAAAQIGKKSSQIIVCKFTPDKDSRSDRQRRLYRMWCKEVADHTGDDKETMHIQFCEKFLGFDTFTTLNGNTRERLITTSDLSVAEMWEYMTHVYIFATQFFEIILSTPDSIGLDRPLPESVH